ncbi:MAG TPA: Asp-tRNA(Asn)/Glu-tRNA(Gln) amidotransferase subunit GatC [Myxococcales bacterium]|nr:Asp-tRNA(Asn)/Glu-tRNA(Gln) amidotransferase subunit GatC [Myxococcales bacterium]
MTIRREDVDAIAELARIEIPEERKEKVAAELSAVLSFAETLRTLDLAGCEPSRFAPAGVPMREDVPNGRRLSPEDALAMAPESEDGFFRVPPIVENLNP